jgi:hypothetical protein
MIRYGLSVSSAWRGHEQFMLWLVDKVRPHTFVELGVDLGFSYFAACHAVKTLGLKTKCFGIDLWQGDEYAGPADGDEERFCRELNGKAFSEFSTLLKMDFSEACEQFKNCSVDLLHIDGRHGYDDVKRDFETWERTLFPGATVLFHDICVPHFGVAQYWAELKDKFQTFEFPHSAGLGVLTYR